MIHQYKLNGYNIVLDVISGAIHVVDDVAYDIISMYENESPEKIEETIVNKYNDITPEDVKLCMEDIEYLKVNEKLFLKDEYEHLVFKNESKVIKAMCLHVSHTCNLNCEYCFAAQGKYHGEDALMSFEVGKRAFDFLIENSGSRKNLEVDFFGGEPLMNWQTVKDLVMYARGIEKEKGKNFRFTFTTNGVLIDEEVIDFCNKEMHNVVLSLDGRKEVHDATRSDYKGRGSYDVVVPKFKEFVEKRNGKNYYMRGTFTANNLDFTNDVFHMADLGFCELSMEPVVSDINEVYSIREEHLEMLYFEYEKLALEMIKRHKENNDFRFYHYILDLKNGPCVHKRVVGCGSGSEYMAVTPTGDLYPCHQFVGNRDFVLGNIYEGVKNTAVQDRFRTTNIYSSEECKKCWAKLYCSGGCAANNFNYGSKTSGVYEIGCKLFKKRIECGIMMQLAMMDNDHE